MVASAVGSLPQLLALVSNTSSSSEAGELLEELWGQRVRLLQAVANAR